MTREEFLENVRKARICPNAFVLDGEENECYVLSGSNGVWSVYYSERGLETGKRIFLSESTALDHLLEILEKDASTVCAEAAFAAAPKLHARSKCSACPSVSQRMSGAV